MSTNKQKYRDLCSIEPTIPIFSRDWWLDAVCDPENWDVAIIEKNNKIIASLPYYITREKNIFKYIKMPKLTQTMGLWVSYPEGQKYTKRLSYEKKTFTELIEQLPEFDRFNQNFHYSIQNWLPFYWEGFDQTTRYTYVIDDLTNVDEIYKGLKENIRREIKKAQKTLKVYMNDDIEKFYDINRLTFERQQMSTPYSYNFMEKLDGICEQNQCRKIFFAEDENGEVHAVLYLIWDQESAYYLMGGGDPELRNSGASSLLMWEAIQFASSVTKKFDFEGSMVEPIERFFRSFGAKQMPYFRISKTNSTILKLRDILK